MSVTLETIQSPKSNKRKKRVGRGNASGRGTYSTRGLKGQRSRSGGKGGLKRRGFRAALQKMPKLRGFNSPIAKKQTVTLTTLDRVAKDGETITPYALESLGVVASAKKGVKIVATGDIKKKVNLEGVFATKKAAEMIEKAGGKITF